jgi:hypothetical protein
MPQQDSDRLEMNDNCRVSFVRSFARLTSTPFDIETPVITGNFIDDFSCSTEIIGIPTKNSIIFAARQEQITVIGRPLQIQNTSGIERIRSVRDTIEKDSSTSCDR